MLRVRVSMSQYYKTYLLTTLKFAFETRDAQTTNQFFYLED